MNTETIAECMRLSFADTPFPAVVGKLAGAGVHAYTADLIALRNTYYDGNAASFDEALPLMSSPAIAPKFDSESVAASVHAIQRGEIGYAEFLRRIMTAGCASYRVFFDGRKAMYFGRDGDFYTEPFPAARS
jgi:uncharacterized protein YbcV (DUF1398 family)